MKEARQKLYIIPFISCYKICKLINNKFCMKMGVGGEKRVERTTNRCEETFGGDAQFIILIVMMVSQLCICMYIHICLILWKLTLNKCSIFLWKLCIKIMVLQSKFNKYLSSFLYKTSADAAKSLQSCPTLCDPIDGSPLHSPIPGILQARILEWVAISFSNAWKWKVKVKSLSHVRLLATPWTTAYQAPPSVGFSRQEYWSGVPLPSPTRLLVWLKCKYLSTFLLALKYVGFFLSVDNNLMHLCILHLFFQLNVIKPILFSPCISE